MDSPKLITIVQQYEELYNLRNPHYSNQQRRDNIWEEIGRRMDQPSSACKSQWTRIRDNHRNALNLRKTKSGQAALKMKPPKFCLELQFLTPYITDEEERISNLTNSNLEGSIDLEAQENEDELLKEASTSKTLRENDSPSPSDCSPRSSSSDKTSDSIRSSGCTRNSSATKLGRGKKIAVHGTPPPSAATVLQNYLNAKANSSAQPTDPLEEFFINMARTGKTFPLQSQIRVKGQLFQMVHNEEMRLVEETLMSNSASSSASSWSTQRQSQRPLWPNSGFSGAHNSSSSQREPQGTVLLISGLPAAFPTRNTEQQQASNASSHMMDALLNFNG